MTSAITKVVVAVSNSNEGNGDDKTMTRAMEEDRNSRTV